MTDTRPASASLSPQAEEELESFLRRQLANWEQMAAAAGHGNSLLFHQYNAGWLDIELVDNCRPDYDIRHIAFHSPFRMRDDANARMAILDQPLPRCPEHDQADQADQHAEVPARDGDGTTERLCAGCTVAEEVRHFRQEILRQLAVGLADTRGADPEWLPPATRHRWLPSERGQR